MPVSLAANVKLFERMNLRQEKLKWITSLDDLCICQFSRNFHDFHCFIKVK